MASPRPEARPGSTHGYDVIDHNQVREAFGGREGFESLREAAVKALLPPTPSWPREDALNVMTPQEAT